MTNKKQTDQFLQDAVEKISRGKYEQAIKDYDKAIELNPQVAKAYFNRGNALAKLSEYDKAIDQFLKLIKFTKNTPDKDRESQKPLYKYIPINPHQVLSLINQELYFTAYHELNDPLECFFIHHEHENNLFGASLRQQNIIARVCALTYQPESKLMYSHYADSHRGLCVEYGLNFEDLSDENRMSYGNVSYSEKDQIYNLNDLYLLKNSDWRYEEEYRLVRFDNEAFFPCEIKSITFGYRCPDEHRKIIYKISRRLNISYWELKQVGQTNDLARVEIDDLKKYQIENDMLFKLMLKYKLEQLYHYYFQTKKTKES